jgi:hypothetical protein
MIRDTPKFVPARHDLRQIRARRQKRERGRGESETEVRQSQGHAGILPVTDREPEDEVARHPAA